MYYYIAEPLVATAEKKRIEEIKSILSQLGIAGEFAIASPARSVEEHLELAFKKGFTTIVGIGSDALANRIASMMIHQEYHQAALGFIPLKPTQTLWHMIGTHSLRETCQNLRTRFVTPIDALQTSDHGVLITDALIHLTKSTRFRLIYRGSDIYGQFTDATIENNGKITLWDTTYQAKHRSGSFLQRFFGPKIDTETAVTLVQSSRWQLETESPCAVSVDGVVVAETPIDATIRPKALKLITKRDKVTKEKEAIE